MPQTALTEASVLAPLVLDVDKAIRVWNQLYPDNKDKIRPDASTMAQIAKQEGTTGEKSFNIISGATYGSSFVGMVHILRKESTVTSQQMESEVGELQIMADRKTFFSSASGSLGVEDTEADDEKSLNSRQEITSHVTVITSGVILGIASTDVQMAVKTFATEEGKTTMDALAALANTANTGVQSMQTLAAIHVLQAQGLPTVSASEAIRLYDASEPPNPVWEDQRPSRKESGLPTVHTRMTACGHLFRLEWRMQIGDAQLGNHCEGPAPAELALRAAQQVALQIRLRAGIQPAPGQGGAPDERVTRLVELAVSLDQLDCTVPLMLGCAERPDCPWPVRAELLWVLAQRQDANTETFAQALVQSAQVAWEPAREGWARLCLAWFHLLARRFDAAVEHAMAGVSLVHRATPHASHAQALLLASQVLAQTGKTDDAMVSYQEADSIAGPVRGTALVCRFKLVQCEFHHLGMAHTPTGDVHAEALEASRLLGMTPMGAWVRIFCGLQACARGGFDACRSHLETAVRAADQASAPLVRLHARLQWGTFLARCGDQNGLDACIEGVAGNEDRQTPFGLAVWRWLRARQLHLQGDARAALPLAEQAMAELSDLTLWWPEDHWLFVLQVALVANSRGTALAIVQRLQARLEHGCQPLRQCTALAAQGMLDYAQGHTDKALAQFEQTRRLGRDTVIANILLFGHTWLNLVDGRNPSLGHLAPAGQWVECTLEGRYLRSMLINKPYWALAQHREPARVGTATELMSHEVADAQGIRGGNYATHLPMPV